MERDNGRETGEAIYVRQSSRSRGEKSPPNHSCLTRRLLPAYTVHKREYTSVQANAVDRRTSNAAGQSGAGLLRAGYDPGGDRANAADLTVTGIPLSERSAR